MTQSALRKIHRWLGLVAGIQLLAWTVSGLYFTLIPIDDIRGNHLLDLERPEAPHLANVAIVSPSSLDVKAQIDDVRLTAILGSPVYLVNGRRFDAETGEPLPLITERDAIAITESRTSQEITGIALVTGTTPDGEYRGGELPAWRVTLAEENAAVYVGQHSGRIRAVRTDAWRLFDFLWSLHIMDYEAREDFNHLLIQVLAILGLITVLSGLALFFVTQRWRTSQHR